MQSYVPWKELDRVTLTSSGADLDTGVFTAKDNIMILAHLLPDSTTACDLTFNGSTLAVTGNVTSAVNLATVDASGVA